MKEKIGNIDFFYKESQNIYDNENLKYAKHIDKAIQYYIDRIKELENQLDYYKKAYENRIETQVSGNHIPHTD